MSWLTPLGFLGLIGIIVLIIIYIIKPNYQQKFISSTFVWKLSLRYRRKRIPINKLRNILLFLCQILIITACAFILAQPIIDLDNSDNVPEKIVIIESSANMMTSVTHDSGETETRFERAVGEVKELTSETHKDGGLVTIILAGAEASCVAQRLGSDMSADLQAQLDSLKADNYGVADIDGAMLLAEKVLEENPKGDVILYTGTEYLNKGSVNVVNVSAEEEWNAAILDARATIEENLYVFTVDLMCYNQSDRVVVNCIISGINGDENEQLEMFSVQTPLENEKVSVRFDSAFYRDFVGNNDTYNWVYSFKEAYFYISKNEGDSYPYDNEFYIYGGEIERVDVQYYSTLANPFVDAALGSVSEQMRNRWDIYVDTPKNGSMPLFEDCDLYVFEHIMPEFMPSDGVVFLINPAAVPEGLDIQLGSEYGYDGEVSLTRGEDHPILNYITPENINVSRNRVIEWYSDEFTPLLYCDGFPALLVKDSGNSKVIILTCHLNYSDLPVRKDFPILMYNIINYFFPTTISGHVYNVGETVKIDARGPVLEMENPLSQRTEYNFNELPMNITLPTSVKGVYSLKQTVLSGEEIVDYFYVKVPSSESEINKIVDELPNPYVVQLPDDELDFTRLAIYFLAALVALMFIEWWLQGLEGM